MTTTAVYQSSLESLGCRGLGGSAAFLAAVLAARERYQLRAGSFSQRLPFAHSQVVSIDFEIDVVHGYHNVARLLRSIGIPGPFAIEKLSCHEREAPFLFPPRGRDNELIIATVAFAAIQARMIVPGWPPQMTLESAPRLCPLTILISRMLVELRINSTAFGSRTISSISRPSNSSAVIS